MEAIRVIVNEHRSLAAVLHGMLYLVHGIRDHDDKPDFNLFGAMIYYIDCVPRALPPSQGRPVPFPGSCVCVMPRRRLARSPRNRASGGRREDPTLEQALARYQQGGKAEFANFWPQWNPMRISTGDI